MEIRDWFRRPSRPRDADDERVLLLESELQRARLELEDRDLRIARMRSEAAAVRDRVGDEIKRQSRESTERIVGAMAVPLTQFLMQAHLHDSGTAEVKVDDVVEVGRRLMRVLRGAGIDQVGTIGAPEPFDPDRHDPLSTSQTPEPGRPVVVRVVGLSFQGRVLRKAGIEPHVPEES
ncbi:nucleotide exchange factor GrpE [Glycomyces buryatensis]|uniref:nucleotide exchange factor GrpE n=1 Tax=Glycomyces buryatensis TaxID=2570927 RepID=UPI0014562E5A|nr:nucleotide exchange factor GrpE [Glycomyces buryatensis]